MKNSTKVRLHLSKQLFESLAKQVLAEAKKGDMSGGAYTEAVKAPKGEKKADKADKGVKTEAGATGFSSRDFAQQGSPKAKADSFSGDSPKKPEATKGASKQGVATSLKQMGVDLQKDPKANVQSAEGGLAIDLIKQIVDLSDDPTNASPILVKLKRVLDQSQPKAEGLKEMETKVAEVEKVQEYTGMHPDTAQLLGTIGNIIAAVGGIAGATTLAKHYFGAGSKEAKDIEAVAKQATAATGEEKPKA